MRGFTIIEFLLVISIISILYAVSLFFLRPEIFQAKARDDVRITDLGNLQSLIENYIADNGNPPDSADALRKSNQTVNPSSNPSKSDGSGWIGYNFENATSKLPTDPLNNGDYIYRYLRVGRNYELDGKLEYYTNLMQGDGQGDGGNSTTRYEKGTDLTILGD